MGDEVSGWVPTKAVRTSSGGVPGNLMLWGGNSNASTWAQDAGYTPSGVVSLYELWDSSSDRVRLKVPKNVGMSSKRIINMLNPVDLQDATTKDYVDTLDIWIDNGAAAVLKTPKPVDMSTHRIYNLLDPVTEQDAATKAYVDGTHTLGNQTDPPLSIGDTSGDPHTYYLRDGKLCDD